MPAWRVPMQLVSLTNEHWTASGWYRKSFYDETCITFRCRSVDGSRRGVCITLHPVYTLTSRAQNALQSAPQGLLRGASAFQEETVLEIVTGTAGNGLGGWALGYLADGPRRREILDQKELQDEPKGWPRRDADASPLRHYADGVVTVLSWIRRRSTWNDRTKTTCLRYRDKQWTVSKTIFSSVRTCLRRLVSWQLHFERQ